MQLPALNPSLIIIAILAFGALYGAMAGIGRLRVLILSIYVGIVLSEQLTDVVRPLAPGLGTDMVALGLLGLPILLFGFSLGKKHGHARGSLIASLILGLASGALIVASALHLMPVSETATIDNGSFLATNIDQFRLWLVALVPVGALLATLARGKSKSHH